MDAESIAALLEPYVAVPAAASTDPRPDLQRLMKDPGLKPPDSNQLSRGLKVAANPGGFEAAANPGGFESKGLLEAQPDWARIYSQLSIYLELILKWNARINLSAIRTPEEIVRRHFGESLFAGMRLGACQTLLDFGSGAGFPGLPIQMLRPDVAVTVAESRSRKAAFLHEVVRSLELPAEVWAGRVEAMPAGRRFDTVTLRAVDNMEAALGEAGRRAGQRILILGSGRTALPAELAEQFPVREQAALPRTDDGVLFELRR